MKLPRQLSPPSYALLRARIHVNNLMVAAIPKKNAAANKLTQLSVPAISASCMERNWLLDQETELWFLTLMTIF
jgi:hypothetical protein